MKLIIMSIQIVFFAMISYSGEAEVKNINYYNKKTQVAAQYEINDYQKNMVRMFSDPGSM
ncbi:hypothetical protein IIU_00826 [Bacillus cereus VD133]|uniref:Uncharacterized protein n=1 Tax=Bacillus cereus VD133 TaxID=1053233 RepID=A0A9W5PVW2_BACCE|nr:hypothetical protein [Bacillus cereus]EOO39008.1 hypothetical protein IIU_00826 [Bacillus cereus VD133]